MIDTLVKVVTGLVRLRGGTDGTVIGNVTDSLKVNVTNSSPIPVSFTSTATTGVYRYGEVLSVATGALTTILTYTVPPATSAVLERVTVSGGNTATYQVLVNATANSTQRTYFGGELNASFEFESKNSQGYMLSAGDIVTITVIHSRPYTADFEATLQVVEL